MTSIVTGHLRKIHLDIGFITLNSRAKSQNFTLMLRNAFLLHASVQRGSPYPDREIPSPLGSFLFKKKNKKNFWHSD